MSKKYLLSFIFGLILVVFGTWAQVTNVTPVQEISEEGLQELFHQVLFQVKDNYVDPVKKREIWFGAIRGMLDGLDDPHTRFMTPEELNELKVETNGKFGGLGLEVSMKDNVLTVVSPIDDTPAMRAGLQPGDKIVEINKNSTQKMSLNDAVQQMRGVPGTSVNIGIIRKDESEILYFDIVRDIIKIKILEYAIINDSNIGYIKLKQFAQNSSEEMIGAINLFKEKKVKGVILDLRWNPGGLLDEAHKVANLFIKEGVIVSTRGRKKELDKVFNANPSLALAADLPLVILANEGSASASEIVTGAVKDLKRGIFIGTKTFGKGSVQSVIPLRYNTAIALTIQKYYTPSGECIHKKGILPDIEIQPLQLTKADRRNILALQDEKIIDSFVTKHPDYTSENVTLFQNEVKEKGIILSDFASHIVLKNKIKEVSKNKSEVFDLEFDTQLKEAITYLNKK